jgi:hypothetical protein
MNKEMTSKLVEGTLNVKTRKIKKKQKNKKSNTNKKNKGLIRKY